MNTLVEFLKNFLLSSVGTFSTIASVLSIAAWLIVIATRKVTRLELSQKQLETGHKEVVKKIDQLSADMRDGFQRTKKWTKNSKAWSKRWMKDSKKWTKNSKAWSKRWMKDSKKWTKKLRIWNKEWTKSSKGWNKRWTKES